VAKSISSLSLRLRRLFPLTRAKTIELATTSATKTPPHFSELSSSLKLYASGKSPLAFQSTGSGCDRLAEKSKAQLCIPFPSWCVSAMRSVSSFPPALGKTFEKEAYTLPMLGFLSNLGLMWFVTT